MPQWKIERELVDQLANPFLEHDTAMIAIATAFGNLGSARDLSDWLDHAARPLFAAAEDLPERAAALGDLMTNQLCLRVRTDGHQALMLDHLIAFRCGHPVLLAALGHEFARRAGWPTVTATAHGQYATVLTDEAYFAPIAYGTPLADAAQLRACCPHTITAATLAAITRHAPADLAASASQLHDTLVSIQQTTSRTPDLRRRVWRSRCRRPLAIPGQPRCYQVITAQLAYRRGRRRRAGCPVQAGAGLALR